MGALQHRATACVESLAATMVVGDHAMTAQSTILPALGRLYASLQGLFKHGGSDSKVRLFLTDMYGTTTMDSLWDTNGAQCPKHEESTLIPASHSSAFCDADKKELGSVVLQAIVTAGEGCSVRSEGLGSLCIHSPSHG